MTDEDLIEANPCKLRNGNWGCKTAAPVKPGDTVRIVTRANKQWRARITQIVWTDETVCICETESEGKPGADSATRPPKSRPDSKRGSRLESAPPTPTNSDDEALGVPSHSADVPPTASDTPSAELDAMADRAAEHADEDDDWMAAYQEVERDNSYRE